MNKIYHYAQSTAADLDQSDIAGLAQKLVNHLNADAKNAQYNYEKIIIHPASKYEDQSTYVVYYKDDEEKNPEYEVRMIEWTGHGETENLAYIDYLATAARWIKENNPRIKIGDMVAEVDFDGDHYIVHGSMYY